MTSSKKKTESQASKFKKAARDVGADEDEDVFDRALRRVAKSLPPRRASDDEEEPGK